MLEFVFVNIYHTDVRLLWTVIKHFVQIVQRMSVLSSWERFA